MDEDEINRLLWDLGFDVPDVEDDAEVDARRPASMKTIGRFA